MSKKESFESGHDDPPEEHHEAPDWLASGGDLGRYIGTKDWSLTPLGGIETWSQSLRTTVSLCTASNFPISIAWGPQHTQIYNDGYRVVCAAKHPEALGQDFSVCWESAWPVIGEAFEDALNGTTRFLEDQRMFLDRNGYLEETFFTFSFSPIRDETGQVAGLFHPATETTSKMLGERRTGLLRELAIQAVKAESAEEAYKFSAAVLENHGFDVPFSLLYSYDEDLRAAKLMARSGMADDCPIAIHSIGTDDLNPVWDVWKVNNLGEPVQVDYLDKKYSTLSVGPYPEPVKTALMLPISRPGHDMPAGFLIVGASSRLPLDNVYKGLFGQIAATITTAITNATAHEEERRQAAILAELDRAKTAFFSNVSHEFRTPLTLMLGPLEKLLADQDISSQSKLDLELAYRNGNRLLKLVNSLLDFSRIEAGRVNATFQPTDLGLLTLDLASVFRSAIESAGLKFKIDVPVLSEPVYVDREMWEKIVLNLLSNALKFTFDGFVSISLKEVAGSAELRVEDSGVGISEAELPKAFDRFHRIEGQRSRSYEGSGIGLALVKELASFHGGDISVSSKPGKGTAFTVRIPLGSSHLDQDRIGDSNQINADSLAVSAFVNDSTGWEPTRNSSESRNEDSLDGSVLVVDDNADMLAYVSSLLSRDFVVITAQDGVEALKFLDSWRPDLILSDVMMPNLDGFGLLNAVRSTPELASIPVIILSARAGEESKIEGLAEGADDYLVKPFSAQELMARVHAHIRLSKERIESEAKLRKLNSELASRTTALELANEELSLFSAAASHDLRGPLDRIGGFTSILERSYGHLLDENGIEMIGLVQYSVQEMKALIESLLDLAMVAQIEPNMSAIDLTSLARLTADSLRESTSAREAQIIIESDLEVIGDSKLLTIAITNLVSNALKYTSKVVEPQIKIGRDYSDSRRPFFVKDNGVGFDTSKADKLFRPFSRLHSSREFVGSGVGLSTVHRIVKRHGGSIWADSEPGNGATFYFTLAPTEEED